MFGSEYAQPRTSLHGHLLYLCTQAQSSRECSLCYCTNIRGRCYEEPSLLTLKELRTRVVKLCLVGLLCTAARLSLNGRQTQHHPAAQVPVCGDKFLQISHFKIYALCCVRSQSTVGFRGHRIAVMPSIGTVTRCGGSVPKHAAEHSGTGMIRGPSTCFPDGSERRDMAVNKHSRV